MVKHTQTSRRLWPTNCLSVFDHFAGLVLKGLTLLTLAEIIVLFYTLQLYKFHYFDTTMKRYLAPYG